MEQTSVDLCRLLAPMHDRELTHFAYKYKWKGLISSFSAEGIMKGYQAYKDWDVLGVGRPHQRVVGNLVNATQNFLTREEQKKVTHKGMVTCCIPLMQK